MPTINKAQRLYVFSAGNGFTTLGFDVAELRRRGVLAWIGQDATPMRVGTMKHLRAYQDAMMSGFAHSDNTGDRCPIELTPALVGLEGKRVEVTTPDGEKSRFYVGKSTGWMPCHLEVKQRNSTGGAAVWFPAGSTVRVVGSR